MRKVDKRELRRMIECGIDISKVDYSHIKDFSALMLNSDIEIMPYIDLSNADNTDEMFSGCSKLRLVAPLNTCNVESMRSMFKNCRSLLITPIVDTSKAKYLFSMFEGCTSLIASNIEFKADCIIDYIFKDCYNLEYIKIMDLRKVRSAYKPFRHCKKLKLNFGDFIFDKYYLLIEMFNCDIEIILSFLQNNRSDIVKNLFKFNDFELKFALMDNENSNKFVEDKITDLCNSHIPF